MLFFYKYQQRAISKKFDSYKYITQQTCYK